MAHIRSGTNPEFLYITVCGSTYINMGTDPPFVVDSDEFKKIVMMSTSDDIDLFCDSPIQVGDLELSERLAPISSLSWRKVGYPDDLKTIQIVLKRISLGREVSMCPVTWEHITKSVSRRYSISWKSRIRILLTGKIPYSIP